MASPVSGLLPLALDEARRVGGSAASDLDAVLGDLEAWVNFDTPSDDVAALDAFAEVLAGTLESTACGLSSWRRATAGSTYTPS